MKKAEDNGGIEKRTEVWRRKKRMEVKEKEEDNGDVGRMK